MKKILFLILLILLSGCDKHDEVQKVKIEEPQKKVELTVEDYEKNNVNELGNVPIMMYHGIHNKKNDDTVYTGGNVDKDGYQRTSESFRNDLEFYYQNGYRMIRLTDYVDEKIDVELGKSPIILTFDDGLSNNIKVNGIDEQGNLIIDPDSAVGIMEEYKRMYPDFNVTATFFINSSLFNQNDYNEKILNWLVDNGYDVGNHTYSHVNFSTATPVESEEEVGKIYYILDEIIPEKYVNIVALPFGSPYSLDHENMNHIFSSTYKNNTYITKSTLRVGWESESSPFSINFNPKFLKRIRAYDNNSKEFDIEMNFKMLETNRYISDGNLDTIVIPKEYASDLNSKFKKKAIEY